MIIYGAGMAGLLAANLLRRFEPVIHEAKKELPDNHSALLRFRTPNIGSACAVPFKKVSVSKAISYEGEIHNNGNLFFSNKYSSKVTGAVYDRSINNLENSERYIAPPNLIQLMSLNIKIEYDKGLRDLKQLDKNEKYISTIPMPIMAKMCGWKFDENYFRFKPIWVQRGVINNPEVSVNQTIYYPDKMLSHYRASVMDNIIIIEHSKKPEQNAGPNLMTILREDFGIDAIKIDDIYSGEQKFGKLLPIDENFRKDFIMMLTEEHNIYSLGRFATWRQLLLDDLVKDIGVIEKLIDGNYLYNNVLENVNDRS